MRTFDKNRDCLSYTKLTLINPLSADHNKSHLLLFAEMFLKRLQQCRPRSDCSSRSRLIWVYTGRSSLIWVYTGRSSLFGSTFVGAV